MIGLFQLAAIVVVAAAAAAVHSPIIFASAFAPPSSSPLSFPVITPAVAGRRRHVTTTLLRAKKKRKTKSASDEDEDDRSKPGAKYGSGESAKKDGNENSTDNNAADDEGGDESAAEDGEPQRTISGGPSLIFEMARRMLVWDDEMYESQILNDAGSPREKGGASGSAKKKGTTDSPSSAYMSSLSPERKKSSGGISPTPISSLPPISAAAAASAASTTSAAEAAAAAAASASPPRWRPNAIERKSISNVNPSFRTSSPIMTNAGYAGILRRNSRKKNKPSMWRHCLRVYGRMGELEESSNGNGDGNGERKRKVERSTAHHEAALVAASKLGMWEEALSIFRGTEESSSRSSSSLSNAISANEGTASGAAGPGPTSSNAPKRRSPVTDNMILSVISACVKGSKVKRTASPLPVGDPGNDAANNDGDVIDPSKSGNAADAMADSGNATDASPPPPSRRVLRAMTIEERRKPLDMARDIILSMEEKHDIPLVSRHVNPLASAYVRIGLGSEAAALINGNLKERAPPPTPKRIHKKTKWTKREYTLDNPGFEPLVDWRDDDLDDDEDDDDDFSDGYEEMQLNIHQMKSKDRGSYSLLVQGAAMDGDWTCAVEELQRMTEAGLHPNSRNLNSWSEGLERGCRPSGNGEKNKNDDPGYYYGGRQRRRSWKKKRDGIWLGNLR